MATATPRPRLVSLGAGIPASTCGSELVKIGLPEFIAMVGQVVQQVP
jgi:hypothetical protein